MPWRQVEAATLGGWLSGDAMRGSGSGLEMSRDGAQKIMMLVWLEFEKAWLRCSPLRPEKC